MQKFSENYCLKIKSINYLTIKTNEYAVINYKILVLHILHPAKTYYVNTDIGFIKMPVYRIVMFSLYHNVRHI